MSLPVWVKKLECENGDSLYALENDLKEVTFKLRSERMKLEREEARIATMKKGVSLLEGRLNNINCRIRIWHEARKKTGREIMELCK